MGRLKIDFGDPTRAVSIEVNVHIQLKYPFFFSFCQLLFPGKISSYPTVLVG